VVEKKWVLEGADLERLNDHKIQGPSPKRKRPKRSSKKKNQEGEEGKRLPEPGQWVPVVSN